MKIQTQESSLSTRIELQWHKCISSVNMSIILSKKNCFGKGAQGMFSCYLKDALFSEYESINDALDLFFEIGYCCPNSWRTFESCPNQQFF